MRSLTLLFAAWCLVPALAAERGPAPIITFADAKPVYHPEPKGDVLPDFSACGYREGQPIPSVPVKITVGPVESDATQRIQRALNLVAALPPDEKGFRGAVLLLKGTHKVSGQLLITNSGVVLRGQGMLEGGTTMVADGLDRRTLIRVFGKNDRQTAQPVAIVDEYVPVGGLQFRVADPKPFKIGQTVTIRRTSTREWIELLGAADFGGGVGGGWKPGSRDITWDRVIKAIDGDQITVEAPLTTALEKSVAPGSLSANDWPGRIQNVGIEALHLVSSFDPARQKDEDHAWCAITMDSVQDAWVRQVEFRHFAGSAVFLDEGCRQVTVRDCLSLQPVSENGGFRRHTFFTAGQKTLFLRCYSEQGRHDFGAGHCAAGPNAFVQCEAMGALADSGPLESWASGVLFDNVTIDGNVLTLQFRPGNHAGVGWSAANCVLWNCTASVIRCWNPPGARNWAFGSWAGFEGDGIWRSSNDFVTPGSLYAAQVRARLGGEAEDRIQLMPRPREESSNPPLEKAQQLAAASRDAPPTLKAYIREAALRDPIPAIFGDAPSVDQGAGQPLEAKPSSKRLVITNGWLTCGNRLLVGGSAGVTWWRGSPRPSEAKSFGLGITRFVPGRVGPGLTDDLYQVTDWLITNGKAALDHNYGLWYDRRRDDHERVRRMDGAVLAPFYEQPFARSGLGAAWDGLSKYDLTRFNPWYWSRLRDFASVCEEKGLVLFHQDYFQHNVLEAGAHWADFPWRSANNINETGFPEPPPYAGDKRIFQAELFYDISHPVRRLLHEGYIRQCLKNFTNTPNIVQFTAAEFTGPLHFMQFWLDTISTWCHETGYDPLVALSCTKDVQDAVLGDAQRAATVDVIDFRYWWRTDKGEFAPPGGKNLAPRQFERQWKGGRPDDLNLAGMAAEYRARFPRMPLICDFDSAGWAWLCAGGSLPRLPQETDPALLAAVVCMQPWPEKCGKGNYVLHGETGCLVYMGASADPAIDLGLQGPGLAVRQVETSSGQWQAIQAVATGGKLRLPRPAGRPGVFWITSE